MSADKYPQWQREKTHLRQNFPLIRVEHPILTARVSGIRPSLDGDQLFIAIRKTSPGNQAVRLVGPPIENKHPPQLIEKEPSARDDLFSMLLVQVLVETAEVLRVVEVFDGQRQFCHLTACNFDYDAGSDIFTIGTQVIANPFGCLQQYEISLVAPIHEACTHTKWEQNKLGVIHPHPQADGFQTLSVAGQDQAGLVSFVRFIRVDGSAPRVLTVHRNLH